MSSVRFTIDDIYVYIFSWKHVTSNARAIFKHVAEHFPHTYFINCDEHTPITDISPSSVIQLDDRYYYGGQFNTAINHLPPGKILACIVGDVTPDADWARIAQNAVDGFNTENLGIYAPNVYFTPWTTRGEHINKELYDVENTDCTCWFLHPRLVENLRHLDYFGISNLGWGIDIIFIKEARECGLKVARDYSVLVKQPKGTNYNLTIADKQMNRMIVEHAKLKAGAITT